MNEKSELINPQKAYFNGKFKEKLQKAPGVQAEMEQKPDCGEDSRCLDMHQTSPS